MASEPSATTVDPIYDAPYLVFVYAAWAAATWMLGDTVGLAVLVAGAATLAITGISQPAPFRPHSFAADLATILLFCGASIGAAWFIVRGFSTMPLTTALSILTIAAVTTSVAPSSSD